MHVVNDYERKGLRIKQELGEAEVPKNKGHNEKTAAMADDGALSLSLSLSFAWEGGAVGQGRARGQRAGPGQLCREPV